MKNIFRFEEFEKLYGGMWDLEVDPIKHAHKMIAHIDKKRQALNMKAFIRGNP